MGCVADTSIRAFADAFAGVLLSSPRFLFYRQLSQSHSNGNHDNDFCPKLLPPMTPIGQLIKEELKAQERSVSWFARKLHLDRSNVYRLFQKNSLDTDLLSRISIVLGRDFFEILSKNIKDRNSSTGA